MRSTGAWIVALVAGLVTAGSARAFPEGYSVNWGEAHEARPAWRETPEGAFSYSIRRGAADSAAARLLGIAESVYPPRDLLIALAVNKNHEMGSDTAGVRLWWHEGPNFRRVPYAVTAGALAHYVGLIEDLRNRTLLLPGVPHPFSARLEYRATIAERDSFVCRATMHRNVSVAHLSLAWSYDDGVSVASLEARRTVVLRPDGEVLDVEGDGGAVEHVGFSDGIGIGRYYQRLR
ncbi:MAG TPA: hypothetical protein VFT32_12485 [Candidatus Eisenbacteria bacterium]|nr:hypothetical protein [Candidatus Eisenbacteria bacterium]